MNKHLTSSIACVTVILLMGASALSVWTEVVRDWLPPVDGPYQTANACRRILHGQMPGRDFVVFHGLGINWYHAPFYACLGGTIRGTLAAYFSAGAVIIPLTLIMAARLGGFAWRAAMIVGLLITNVMLVIPGPSYTAVMPGGNMLGTRISLSLLPVLLVLFFCQKKRPVWQVVIAVGTAIGVAMSISQDQGTSLLAGSAMAFLLARASWSQWKTCLAAGAGALLTSAFVYLIMITLMTGGSPQEYLIFAWKRIPENQFWLYGSLLFFGEWKDLWNMKYVIVPLAVTLFLWSAALVIRRIGRRDREDSSMILPWMGWYSVASLHPLLGYLSGHYFASAMYAALIMAAFSMPALWNVLKEMIGSRLGTWTPVAGLTLAVLLCGLEFTKNSLRQWMGKSYAPLSAWAYLPEYEALVAQEDPNGFGLSASRQAEVVKNLTGPGHNVWSTFSGQERETCNIVPEGRHDYLFYVLGNEARSEYISDFTRKRPDWVLTARQSSGQLEQWISKIYWDWYKELALHYEPALVLNQELVWRKREGSEHKWISAAVPSQSESVDGQQTISFTADVVSALPQLHEVSFRYRLSADPLPVVSRRLCRVMVGRDTPHPWSRQSLEVRPGDAWMEASMPVITRPGENVVLRLETISPAGAPRLEVAGVRVVKLTGCSALTPAALESDVTAHEFYQLLKKSH